MHQFIGSLGNVEFVISSDIAQSSNLLHDYSSAPAKSTRISKLTLANLRVGQSLDSDVLVLLNGLEKSIISWHFLTISYILDPNSS